MSYLFTQLFGVQKYDHKSMEINKTFCHHFGNNEIPCSVA